MRLTRRGKALVVVCAGGFVLAGLFGSRALNAIVLPGIVALVAGALQIRSLATPTVERDVPRNDFVGQNHDVSLRFGGVSRPFVGTVTDDVDDGLSNEMEPVTTAVGDDPVTYTVTYESRGEHQLGPARVVGRDVLGLFETELVCRSRDTLLAYPRLHSLAGWAQRDLFSLHETDRSSERAEFDNLREYVRGDALRDIHWKSSAKRDDLIVQEFAADRDVTTVTIRGGCDATGADQLAEAVASIAVALHDADIPVTLSLPNGRVDVDTDRIGRTRLLEHCARVVAGPVPDDSADIVVEARGTTVEVTFGDRQLPFDELRGGQPSESNASRATGGATA